MQPSISEIQKAAPAFALEACTPELLDELLPLLVIHYKTVAHFKDIELAPCRETYLKLQEAGLLRVFTAREGAGGLIGYAVFFVKPNIHYRYSLQAQQDVLFIHPERRGFGSKFVAWCDEQLAAEGVQVSVHHVKAKKELNFAPMLEKQGYELVDLILAKRLDKGRG